MGSFSLDYRIEEFQILIWNYKNCIQKSPILKIHLMTCKNYKNIYVIGVIFTEFQMF